MTIYIIMYIYIYIVVINFETSVHRCLWAVVTDTGPRHEGFRAFRVYGDYMGFWEFYGGIMRI